MKRRAFSNIGIELHHSLAIHFLDEDHMMFFEDSGVCSQRGLLYQPVQMRQHDLRKRRGMQSTPAQAIKLWAELEAVRQLHLLNVSKATKNIDKHVSRAFRNIEFPAELGNIPAAARRVEKFKDREGPLN